VPDNFASAWFTIGTLSVFGGCTAVSVVAAVEVFVSSSVLLLQENIATDANMPALNKNLGEKEFDLI
jgi:hypothetical protein